MDHNMYVILLTSWYAFASAVSSINLWTSSKLISLWIALIALFPAFKLSNTAFCLLVNSISDNYNKKEKPVKEWIFIEKKIKRLLREIKYDCI